VNTSFPFPCAVALALLSASAPLFAQNDNASLRRPDDIEARPPIHIQPYLYSSPAGYAPAQIRHAYGVDQLSGDGAGQTIAIVDAYGNPNVQADLNTFCLDYGLPPVSVSVQYPQGKVARTDSGWALETNLDVQWAHAIAPKANIVLVVAKSASLSNLLSAVDTAVKLGAKVVSMSWGGSEFSSEASYDSHFNKSGVTFVASSGDNGAGVMWPAASPYVLAVGGTTLSLDQQGNVASETAWSGSGGGVSAYEVRPGYQQGWSTYAGRAVPDVSYNANPNSGVSVYISNYNGSTGWITVGGTSAGAPQWAGLLALTNAARTAPLGAAANGAIYSCATTAYLTDFRDVSSGSNGLYTSGANFDLVTGLGSPVASQLVPALIAR
jgi:subtilase family serine protease